MRPANLAAICAGTMLVVAAPGTVNAFGTCGSGGAVGSHVKVDFDGSYYFVYSPSIDAGKPLPLVLVLHGDEGDPDAFSTVIWGPVWSAKKNFILVLPRASGGSWWRAASMYEGWMDKLIASLASRYNVDVDRIYATGNSGGSTFLSWWGWKRQNVFAAIQLSCGGYAPLGYAAPPRADCKTRGRFVSATDDMPYNMYQHGFKTTLDGKGHVTDLLDAPCSGHCCGPYPEYTSKALAFFLADTHCTRASTGAGCGKIGDLPGAAPGDPSKPDGGGAGGTGGGGSGGGAAGGAGGGSGGGGSGGGGSGGGGSGGGGSGGGGSGGGGSGSGGDPGGSKGTGVTGGCSLGGGTPGALALLFASMSALRLRRRSPRLSRQHVGLPRARTGRGRRCRGPAHALARRGRPVDAARRRATRRSCTSWSCSVCRSR